MSRQSGIAVCVHVYYADMWGYLSGYIRNFPDWVDIFVTCREEIRQSLSETVLADFPRAEVLAMPNLGMDVLPFLQLCRDRELYRYDAILKLHTKNQKSQLRSDQGKIMLDGLCGSEALVDNIIDIFKTDPEAGMVGTAFQIRSANALMYGNRARMTDLLETLGIELTDWPFFTGTMFWIAGSLLRNIVELVPEFLDKAQAEATSRTGGDGSLAHTLERVFGALSAAAAATIYLCERKDPDSGDYLILPQRKHGPANRRRLLELESTELVRRHMEASKWCKLVRDSGLFDIFAYRTSMQQDSVPGIDEIYHFVLYGDILALDPSPEFNVSYYQIRRPDVVRARICSLVHYINAGQGEGLIANPGPGDWFDLAKRLKLFDAKYYAQSYPDVRLTGLDPEEHYLLVSDCTGRDTNVNFQPSRIPVLAKETKAGGRSVMAFLQNYFLPEAMLYQALKRAGDNGDFALAQSLSQRILRLYGPGRALHEAVATAHTLHYRWGQALEAWQEFWDDIKTGQNSGRHVASAIQFDHPSRPLPGFERVEPTHGAKALSVLSKEAAGKVCVYTTLFGNIDNLNPVTAPADGVDYLCFTDRPREAPGWTQVIVDPQQPSDNLNAKIFKVLPHRYLQNYDYSMFVDANTVFLGRTAEFIELCRQGGDFVMWQHPLRDDIYVEACAIIGHRRHSPAKLIEQLRHYHDNGMPHDTGMFEASFIWRRHKALEVVELMEQWWQQICSFSSRDQLSLAYLVWKTGIRPKLLSPDLGDSRKNIYFFKAPHSNGKDAATDNPLLSAPGLAGKPRDITFLYHEKAAGVGSTVLRGQQLSSLVKAHYEGAREVRYLSTPDQIAGEIVVLTKGFLKAATAEQLHDLRQRNILIADFVDEPPKPELINELDVLMASSLCGYKDYLSAFPQLPAFHVTHHVDVRIPRCEEASVEDFRAGYFGELVNTIRGDGIDDLVDFNLVDTSKQTNNWIDALSSYNFHYAFRRRRGIDGAKPFLKGFVAAHRGVNMMIQRDAGDAAFYLGSDYPYLMAEDATPKEIIEALQAARDTIGGAEWKYGREIMRDVQKRSSVDHVLGEFDQMLSVL